MNANPPNSDKPYKPALPPIGTGTITRRDVALGRVAPKVIMAGDRAVVVAPELQINGETLAEHQRRLRRSGLYEVTIEQAARMGYDVDEIREYFK